MITWKAQDIENSTYLGGIELDDNYFEVVQTADKLVFGDATNIGLLQSGYYILDNDFSLDENLADLYEDLVEYYIDGRPSESFVCNRRM